MSGEKLKLLEAKVLAKCAAQDGLADGLLDDPRQCKFEPAKDLPLCSSAEAADCFSAQQIAALQKIYGGARNRQGQLNPGFPPGVESGWNLWLGEGNQNIKPLGPNLSYAYGEGFLRYWIYDNPNYKLHQFNFEKDIAATQAAAKLVNATDTNLKAFQRCGGKLIFLSRLGRQRFSGGGGDSILRTIAAHDGWTQERSLVCAPVSRAAEISSGMTAGNQTGKNRNEESLSRIARHALVGGAAFRFCLCLERRSARNPHRR